ncbi:MAG TPA: anaerobic glycerol-3-phosphate dehydrogenase subunit C [bacterium]
MTAIYDHHEARYWDAQDLDAELTRVFDLCHGCRRCFNLCESFPYLFDRVDALDGDVPALNRQVHRRTVALCHQCKVCGQINCPYVPPHEWQLDFPKLMLRARAVWGKREGIPLRDRLLTDTDRIGKLGAATAGLTNWANRNPLARSALHTTFGIHRDKTLPRFHHQTFIKWIKKNDGLLHPQGEPVDRVVLFPTCMVDYNDPAVGQAAVRILHRNRVEVAIPEAVCCGMPFLDCGAIADAVNKAEVNVAALMPWIDKGYKVVVPVPTCSLTFKKEYPDLLGTPEAARLSENTLDLFEFLFTLKQAGTLDRDFSRPMGTIAYHIPCHLRDQNIGFRSRDIMKLIPETQVRLIDKCSGHDGTWSMKRENFAFSMKIGQKLFDSIGESEPDIVASDCPLSCLQIHQGTGRKAYHPAQVVAAAYGYDEVLQDAP